VRALGISIAAGCLTLALVAALAGAALGVARVAELLCHCRRRGRPPTGAAVAYQPAPAGGLDDLEAGEDVGAVPVKGKA
jgi:hypothetical protein